MRNRNEKSWNKVLLGVVAGLGLCISSAPAGALGSVENSTVDDVTLLRDNTAYPPRIYVTVLYTYINTSITDMQFEVQSTLYGDNGTDAGGNTMWHAVSTANSGLFWARLTPTSGSKSELRYNFAPAYPNKAFKADGRIYTRRPEDKLLHSLARISLAE